MKKLLLALTLIALLSGNAWAQRVTWNIGVDIRSPQCYPRERVYTYYPQRQVRTVHVIHHHPAYSPHPIQYDYVVTKPAYHRPSNRVRVDYRYGW